MKHLAKRAICDLFNVVGYEAHTKGIKILECTKEEADRIIVEHHYSHKVTQNSCISMLVYYNGKVEGALQIGYGIRPKYKGT